MRHRRTPIILAGALLAAAVSAVSGCSTTPTLSQQQSLPAATTAAAAAEQTPTPSAQPLAKIVDVCTLIDQQSAETLVGTPLDTPDAGNPDNPSCTYNSPTTGPTAQVNAYAGDGAKKTYDIDVTLGHTFTDVPGLGDEAHAEDNAIFARVGSTWLSLSIVLLNDPSENTAALQTAMATMVSRL
ncbi:DUF3558 domain-containing protein [Subtercola sp. PAMC28395]|uniref:DUF3558 domain-containing protein n=1 Tax=Subtercola sp. PAMC28395 TaxID=2846775 RepID=UPI001C0D3B74|nr:DUF3558 domain-containing protein [Subtercola sp. PAMC28395]QWT22882.1 DUF3558 domain-containing protein [Subtercola sp. PAMC28395]